MLSERRSDAGFLHWAPLVGKWTLGESEAVYHGEVTEQAYGLVRAPDSLGVTTGIVSCLMRFPPSPGTEPEPQGRIAFGFNPRTQHHYSAGIGGFRALYSIEQFIPGQGWSPLASLGRADALPRDRPINVVLRLGGQSVALDVDDVIVADVQLPGPLESSYLGFVARGSGDVRFTDFVTEGQPPDAFIVMQFGEPFDTLYGEVIAPVCAEMGTSPSGRTNSQVRV